MSGRRFLTRGGLAMIAAATVAFALLVALLGFGDALRSGRDGQAHALSPAATGFAGIARILALTDGGGPPRLARDPFAVANADLLVVTAPFFADIDGSILSKRGAKPTLVVLPKWGTMPDPLRRGWVRSTGPLGFGGLQIAGVKDLKVTVRDARKGEVLRWPERDLAWPAPAKLQTIAGEGLTPLVAAPDGGAVLVRLADRPVYVLADPDLISNQALGTPAGAERAVRLFDQLPGTRGAVFDVTLNGYGRSPSLIRLAFTPPFLALSMTLLAAAAMVVWGAAARFGSSERAPERAHAFGTAALIANTADLVAQARAEGAFAVRYAAVVRDRSLARRRKADADYDALAADAAAARDGGQALTAAQRLWDWMERA